MKSVLAQVSQVFDPISITSSGDFGNGWSDFPSISSDGRFVAFASTASNLVSDDTNGVADIFVYDRMTGEKTLASISSIGVQANALSARPSISGNGRFVAFESLASNLVSGDFNGQSDIFVHDLITGETRRVSVSPEGREANGWSERVSNSIDGRYLVFLSTADNLVRNDVNGTWDVFIHDQVTGNLIRASVSSSGEGANAASNSAVISGDGRIVTFVSEGDNLVENDTNEQPDVFTYFRVLAQTTRINVSPDGQQANHWSAFPDISGTGRNIVFASAANNLARGEDGQVHIYHYDRLNGTMQRLETILEGGSITSLSLSENGRVLVYRIEKGDEDGELWSLDLRTGSRSLIYSGVLGSIFDLPKEGHAVAFTVMEAGNSQVYINDQRDKFDSAYFLAGQVTDSNGKPVALVSISDHLGNSTRTGIDGRFFLAGYELEKVTLTATKEGYTIAPSSLTVEVNSDIPDLKLIALPEEAIIEGRKDLGMPYSFNRGCSDPFIGCGGRYHGFSAGYCTDLVLDSYRYGVDFNIQYALEQDAMAHPDHFYRWRNARNTHDMWRYFSYTGQMLSHETPYQPGDIVFFDWSDDGEIDHVALISLVNEFGRPEMMVDATGVINLNPSGLAAELEWTPFHEGTVRGHARWSGAYEPIMPGFQIGSQVLQIALGGGVVSLRLVDKNGNAVSLTENGIKNGTYFNLVWEEIISVQDPLSVGGSFFVEITSQSSTVAPYQFTVQIVEEGLVKGRVSAEGNIGPNVVRRIPVSINLDDDGDWILKTFLTNMPKVRGIFIRP